jgi:hypothetical protein
MTEKSSLEQRVAELEQQRQQDRREKEQLRNRVEELENKLDTDDNAQPNQDELRNRVDELESTNEDLQETVENQQEEIDDLKSELVDAKSHAGKNRGLLNKRIATLEDTIEEVGLSEANGSDVEGTVQTNDLTPIERLSQAEDASNVTDSTRKQRAIALFKNLANWGSKTPKGIILKPADNPLSLLEADRDESLAWKQYYRAANALEKLSHGSVTFFDSDRHGKTICLHEQSKAYERLTNGSLTMSSARAEG